MSDEILRSVVRDRLQHAIDSMNAALRGKGLRPLEPALKRLGRTRLPHWYEGLKSGSLPNLQSKTIGSVVEMLFAAVLETKILRDHNPPPLRLNAARGVDLPDLNLGVKSPSENFCTSEPFYSAYERIIGCNHDIVVLLTDYQRIKGQKRSNLQIQGGSYLQRTQVADSTLCRIALKHRDWLISTDEARAKRVFRFLAYVNQGDWKAKRILDMIDHMQEPQEIARLVTNARHHFQKTNQKRLRSNEIPIPEADLNAVMEIADGRNAWLAVLDAAENWVIESQKDRARPPSDSEWDRFATGPLDGRIGMSLALQWRYNFKRVFTPIPPAAR